MIRFNDLDESLKFYCDGLGIKLLAKWPTTRTVDQ
ncbi:MAG TPA: VOC family protein [Candidatus Binatia bacterium]|nr:VOC family protein [Candidatus Binatia bacterium]